MDTSKLSLNAFEHVGNYYTESSEGLSKIAIYDINIFTLLIIRILIINVKTLKLSKFRNSTGDFLMPLIINDV